MATEKRLIDTNVLMEDSIWKCGGDPFDPYYMGYQDALDNIDVTIENQPTVDAVEVVRCRACKYCDYAFDKYWCEYFWNKYQSTPSSYEVKADGFCHNGERKDK